jgi:hypothetical protein
VNGGYEFGPKGSSLVTAHCLKSLNHEPPCRKQKYLKNCSDQLGSELCNEGVITGFGITGTNLKVEMGREFSKTLVEKS